MIIFHCHFVTPFSSAKKVTWKRKLGTKMLCADGKLRRTMEETGKDGDMLNTHFKHM